MDNNISLSNQEHFKNDHDNQVDNPNVRESLAQMIATRMSRRQILKASTAFSATAFMGHSFAASDTQPLIGFTPVKITDGSGPIPSISPDYEYQVFIPWGDKVNNKSADYSYPPNAEDQANQIGIGHDGMHFFPAEDGNSNQSGVLTINHEFGKNEHILGKPYPESLDDVRTVQHAHGISVLEIEQKDNIWYTRLDSKVARRIHANTPMAFSGPAKDSALLKTPNNSDPKGTFNNCANGHTPWNTYLTCEENFNGYFGVKDDSAWSANAEQARYGLSSKGFDYQWHQFDERFDLANPDYAHEENRFGWVVEIDPFDPDKKPVKRTALGRLKHEGATVAETEDGRIVVYMGDDQRFEYIYKFVSKDNWKTMQQQGLSPLDEGTLYVARFNDDGTGTWLPLEHSNPILKERFNDQAEILVYTRFAADAVGATPMDRPEWITVAPNGDVYCTLTNNKNRAQVNAANPQAPNPDGHIIRWREDGDYASTTFKWTFFLIASDSHGTESTYSDPDGIWADPDGRIFIETDGSQKDDLNNQLLVADAATKEIKRLFTGVTKCEITGITTTPDRRTLFVNIQHPGNGDPLKTNFPAATDGITIPRDATVVIRRKDGGIVGS